MLHYLTWNAASKKKKKKCDHLMIGAERWAVVIISALNVITNYRGS